MKAKTKKKPSAGLAAEVLKDITIGQRYEELEDCLTALAVVLPAQTRIMLVLEYPDAPSGVVMGGDADLSVALSALTEMQKKYEAGAKN